MSTEGCTSNDDALLPSVDHHPRLGLATTRCTPLKVNDKTIKAGAWVASIPYLSKIACTSSKVSLLLFNRFENIESMYASPLFTLTKILLCLDGVARTKAVFE